MKKGILGIMVVLLSLLLTGCGSSSGSSSASNTSSSTSGASSRSNGSSSSASTSSSSASSSSASSSHSGLVNRAQSSNQASSNQSTLNPASISATSQPNQPNSKMIIYNANLSIEVKNYNQFQNIIESDIQNYKGYIVNMSQDQAQGNLTSHLTIRVPQPKFYALLDEIKKNSDKVLHNELSGKDVTKQYVDLQAQLKAQQLVEQRLQTFMKKTTNTTDLLKISDELGKVETQIDSLKGQMKYLENQSSLSTITLVVTENKVTVPKLQTNDLNTWQKAQKAFMTTIQGLTTFISWLVVFVIGAAPVLVILLIGVILYFVWRKKRKKKETKD